jgi:hypothetical protein
MAEKAISKLLRYIEPLITFSDSHIDMNGFIRPIGVVDQNYRTSDGKDIKVPRSYEEWSDFRSEKDTEIFNPFVVTKHMVFLSELVRRKLNEIYAPVSDCEAYFDDEEIEDNSEVVRIVKTDAPGISIITFVMMRGGEEEPVAEGAYTEDGLALWLACANAVKTHTRKPPEVLLEVEKFLEGMPRLLERFQKERKDFMKDEYEMDGLNSEDLELADDEYEPIDNVTDAYFVDNVTINGDMFEDWTDEFTEDSYGFPKFRMAKGTLSGDDERDARDISTLMMETFMEDMTAFDNFNLDMNVH